MERVLALPRRLRVAFLSTFVRTVQKIILMSILIFYLLKWSASSIRRASRQVKKEYWVKVTPLDWWKKEWSNKNNHTLIILINTFPLFCQVRGCTGSKKETADQQKFHLHGWIRFNSGHPHQSIYGIHREANTVEPILNTLHCVLCTKLIWEGLKTGK